MTLAATTVSSVALASQSAILGYRQSALACILVYLIKFRGHDDEETTSNRNRCAADGNLGICPIRSLQSVDGNQICVWVGSPPTMHCTASSPKLRENLARAKAVRECRAYGFCGQQRR